MSAKVWVEVLNFWVPGHPKTKGSLTPRAPKCHCCAACKGPVRMPQLRDTEASKRWRKLVAYGASQAMRDATSDTRGGLWPVVEFPILVPVRVDLEFALAVEHDPGVGLGDLDKLERNVLDALGRSSPDDAGVYGDDVQVVAIESSKVVDSLAPGVRIRVYV